MKIAYRGGHNLQAPGANALLDEVTEDRKILEKCIQLTKIAGHEVLDCTPGNCDANSDLAYGVNKANAWGADVYIPIHLNKAYKEYNGKIGTEVIVYSHNDYAAGIVKELSDLGFKNRGQKINTGLYDLRNTTMTACIVEVCFVEATEDVRLYNEVGVDRIAQAIVRGVLGTTINYPQEETSKPIVNTRWDYEYDSWIIKLQQYLNARGHRILIDGVAGENTYNAIKGYTLSLNERATLAKLVQERLVDKGYLNSFNDIDGIVGPVTYAAINKFQRDNGLGVGYLGGTDWYYLIR